MDRDLKLSSDAFLSLIQVFKKNGWEIPDKNAGLESRFNRFCERLSMFDSAEQHLIIELTQRFVVIDVNDYSPLLLKLLDRIREDGVATFKDVDKFFIFPLVAPEDIERTKSSNFVWYYFQNEHIKYNPIFLGKTLVYCDIHKIFWATNLKQNEKVILLDDYIGSGETAVSALEWFCNDYKIPAQNIIILSIAAQEIGMKYIQEKLGVDVFSYYIFTRGISDYYKEDSLPLKTSIMEKIEEKLKVEDRYLFGYNRSEALISLIRTPNNTFSVFWKTQGKNKIVPFPRN